jgi:hypothetical protein
MRQRLIAGDRNHLRPPGDLVIFFTNSWYLIVPPGMCQSPKDGRLRPKSLWGLQLPPNIAIALGVDSGPLRRVKKIDNFADNSPRIVHTLVNLLPTPISPGMIAQVAE